MEVVTEEYFVDIHVFNGEILVDTIPTTWDKESVDAGNIDAEKLRVVVTRYLQLMCPEADSDNFQAHMHKQIDGQLIFAVSKRTAVKNTGLECLEFRVYAGHDTVVFEEDFDARDSSQPYYDDYSEHSVPVVILDELELAVTKYKNKAEDLRGTLLLVQGLLNTEPDSPLIKRAIELALNPKGR